MKNRQDPLIERLARAARRASLPDDAAPPPGFADRVLAGVRSDAHLVLWRRLTWASLAAAALVWIACLGREWTAPRPDDVDVFAAQLTTSLLKP
jgi:hypothetical protein